MVLVLYRAPGLLRPDHFDSLLSLVLSGLMLYLAWSAYFLGFFAFLSVLNRLPGLRLPGGSVALASLVLGLAFLEAQVKLQFAINGMYISLGSPRFYIPTLISAALAALLFAAGALLVRRLPALPAVTASLFAWPRMVGTSCAVFVLAVFLTGFRVNVLGVLSDEHERASTVEQAPLPAEASPGAPNFIVLAIEALRSDYFTEANAPFLWRLAGRNVRFSRSYTVSSATRPSVTSLFTSLYPSQHGCYNLSLDRSGDRETVSTVKASEAITALPRLLQEHGYQTIEVTSNMLTTDRAFGFEKVFHRFDVAEPYRFGVPSFDAFVGFHKLKNYSALWRIFKIFVFPPDHSLSYFDSPRLNLTVERELEEARRPLFLYVHYMEPHAPYYHHPYRPFQVNLYLESRSDDIREAYRSEIAAADVAVAGLFDHLEKEGWLENSYVLITSDHGEEMFDHLGWGHGKGLYREVIDVPAILVLPAGKRIALEVGALVENIDIAPTFAELAGIPAPESWEGSSLVSYLFPGEAVEEGREGENTPERAAFSQFEDASAFWSSVVTEGWQLITREQGKSRKVMLFDLAADPAGLQNLAGTGQESEGRLLGLLERERTRAEATAWSYRGMKERVDKEHLQQLKALGYVE